MGRIGKQLDLCELRRLAETNTTRKLAEHYKVSLRWMQFYLNKNGIRAMIKREYPNGTGRPVEYHMPDLELLQQLAKDHSIMEISEKLNLPYQLLYRYMKLHKISAVKKRRSQLVMPSKAELIKLYKDHTLEEVADLYAVGSTTMRKWIHIYDISKAKLLEEVKKAG